MKAIFSGHFIKTQTDVTVEPGHQLICVGPAGLDSAAILFVLTGVWKTMRDIKTDDSGQSWICAPHDSRADERLMQLVDICADLRFTAPYMLQLGLKLDEHS
jgi:hypothetical protein